MRSLRRLTAVLIAAVLTGACSGGGDGGGTRGPPIVVGLINQEGSAAGSFPEVGEGAEAAVRHVNEQDGVGGRRLELETCATRGSAESSRACAERLRQQDPVAVIGGVDTGAGASFPALAEAGIPYLGGTPTLGAELTSPTAFLLTGGAAADVLGEAKYVTETLHLTRVGVLHIDLPGVLSTAVEAVRQILGKKGVTDVNLVAERADAADFTAALTSLNASSPEAILVVFPPESCLRIMQAAASVGVRAMMFYPGACAREPVLEAAAGGASGAYFASGFLSYDDRSDPQVGSYRDQMERAGPGAFRSTLSQAGFGMVMNLAQLLREPGGTSIDPAALTRKLEESQGQPAFMSHTYTCDRKQVPLLLAVCNADVRILQERDGSLVDVVGDWINGADLIRLFTR